MSSPAPYAGARVLVLGSSGFIGAAIARALHDQRADLHVAARDPNAATRALPQGTLRASVHGLDASATGAAAELIQRLSPDVTFNGVGYGIDRSEHDDARFTTLNAALPGELAQACASLAPSPWAGQRLIHLGSALEYGTASGDLREDGPHTPTTAYGLSKLAGTRAVSAAAFGGLRAITARLFTVYGPGEHPGRLLPSLLAASRNDEPIPFTEGLQQRDFTYVGDVVEGALRLGALPGCQPSVMNLATGTLHSVRHFVEEAVRELHISPGRLRFGALPTRPEEMLHGPVTVARLTSATGWKPETSIAEGIRQTHRRAQR